MSVMKQVVLSMSTRSHGTKKTQAREHLKPKSASVHIPNASFETYDDPNVSKPGSISLVSITSAHILEIQIVNQYIQVYKTKAMIL